jgi:outer membrane receptor for ferric coprogen and ferric-rhodotorulic acid
LVLYRARQGHQRRSGFESEWRLVLQLERECRGYTFVNSEPVNGERKGERYDPRIPKQIFRIASTCRIPGSHWTVGGNLRAQSRTSGNYGSDGRFIKQGGFALVGLMAKYRINDQAEISLVADNVFDRRCYPNNLDMTHYGEPRSVFTSVRYQF